VTRDEQERFQDILDSIEAIRSHATSAESAPPGLALDAILYRLVVIGEAVKAVSDETRNRHPDVNWRGIAGLRDLLTHEYFRVDSKRIDEIIELHLEPFDRAVNQLLAS
jgi:uncharacterized protein with HEPN domain